MTAPWHDGHAVSGPPGVRGMLKYELSQITTYSRIIATNYKKFPARRRKAELPPDCKRTPENLRRRASRPIYPGFLAVTFHELESIMTPFGR